MNKTAFKKKSRLRRSKKLREHVKRLGVPRMSVQRTLQHIYVQVIDTDSTVICSANTLEKEISSHVKYGGNCDAAAKVGALIAKRCLDKEVKKVAFDRSGFKFHGRLKALADASREAGMEF